ncbi:ParB/RepB/Spo0J family partition protein [Clostridioides difficile]|uniref:ParB/RepB/Spo0J family partition protein n=1 Tax=Clostridioides difficile TaxID=1496 RepID=UPI0009391FA3|nr:ParB/RepB/Spo0J family partition protein [Clostridioides difficile]
MEHEGQAALFEMGEAIPDAPEFPGVTIPEQPEPDKPEQQASTPGKVVDFAAAREETGKATPPAKEVDPPDKEHKKPEQPRRGRPSKADKAAPSKADPAKKDKATPTKAEKPKRDKMSQSKAPPPRRRPPLLPSQSSPPSPVTLPEPKEEIVYLNLSELHPFQDHPFGVRDDAEMQGLVESVKAAGVNQPALVRPREGGGYEIIAGHRRQRASELAGFSNMPCIVRKMTDDEAILAMTDDNLRHREKILPTEKAKALKQQVEAIKHQGARPGEDDKDAGKRSTQVVGDRNGMNYKQVQRYIRLTELVPDLKKMLDEKQLAFTPAVEISFIRPKHQRYIAVAIEGQQSSPSLSQAQKLRELDKQGALNGDVIDGILSEQKKEVDKVIINSVELEKYFGKDKSPREMKDKIISLLDDWKAKQPPELGKPDKKKDMEK